MLLLLFLAPPAQATNSYCEAADGTTTSLGLCKPDVDVEGANSWGDKYNANSDLIDTSISGINTALAAVAVSTASFVRKIGDTMTGPLYLTGAQGFVNSASSITAANFYGDGSHLTGVTSSGGFAGFFVSDDFLSQVNGIKTTFTLSQAPASIASLVVILDGLVETYGTDYTFAYPTLTMNSPPAANSSSFFAYYTVNTTTLTTISTLSVLGSVVIGSTLTVQGSGFSVGGSSFTIVGGSATVAYGLTSKKITVTMPNSTDIGINVNGQVFANVFSGATPQFLGNSSADMAATIGNIGFTNGVIGGAQTLTLAGVGHTATFQYGVSAGSFTATSSVTAGAFFGAGDALTFQSGPTPLGTQLAAVASSTTSLLGLITALEASTTTLSASTASLRVNIASVGASTQTIAVAVGASTQTIATSVGSSTQTLSVNVAASTTSNGSLITALEASTTTLSASTVTIVSLITALEASTTTLSASTASLRSNITSVGASTQTLSVNVAASTTTLFNVKASTGINGDITALYGSGGGVLVASTATFTSSVTFTNSAFSVGTATLTVVNGRVGIGIAAPLHVLDVEATTANGTMTFFQNPVVSNFSTIFSSGNVNGDYGAQLLNYSTSLNSGGLKVGEQHATGKILSLVNIVTEQDSFLGDGSVSLNTTGANKPVDVVGPNFTVGVSTLVVKGGNVGIGITNPAANLQIVGNSTSGQIELSSATPTGTKAFFGVEEAAGNLIAGSTPGDLSIANSAGNIRLSANNGAASQFTLQNNGNVGIGTTTPTVPLHVWGTDVLTKIEGAGTANQAALRFATGGSNRWDIGVNDNLASSGAKLEFNRGGGTPAMVIDGSDRVGIGTTNPQFAFQVAGVAVSSGVTDGSDALAGRFGEYISTTAVGSMVPGATLNSISLATSTLTAGDWEVQGCGNLNVGATTAATQVAVCISVNPNSCDNTQGRQILSYTVVASAYEYICTPVRRISISSTAPIYLTGYVAYTVLGGAAWDPTSFLRARRVR